MTILEKGFYISLLRRLRLRIIYIYFTKQRLMKPLTLNRRSDFTGANLLLTPGKNGCDKRKHWTININFVYRKSEIVC